MRGEKCKSDRGQETGHVSSNSARSAKSLTFSACICTSVRGRSHTILHYVYLHAKVLAGPTEAGCRGSKLLIRL